jgi:gliding motility-associated lipoprotein GldH
MKSIVVLIISIAFLSCNQNIVFNDYTRIGETEGWARNIPIKFEVDITDTNQPYDIYVNVRQATGYPYSNLFLHLNTEYPDRKNYTDTLECLLANERGEWLGDGAGDLWDNKILFKKAVKFNALGKHIFTFKQGMRLDPLPLILDIGLTIEKSNSQ